MLSLSVSAIFGSALFTCDARFDWLVRVPQRLICEGKEPCVEKRLQTLVVSLVFLRHKTTTTKTPIFRKNAADFFLGGGP